MLRTRFATRVLSVPLVEDRCKEGGFAPPPKGYQGPGAALTLLPTRTKILGAELADGSHCMKLVEAEKPGVLALLVERLPKDEVASIAVRYTGEAPSLAAVEWSEEKPPTALGLSPDEMAAERIRAISCLKEGPVQSFAHFFADYDLETNVAIGALDNDGRIERILALQSLLCRRVIIKARKFSSGNFPKGIASSQAKEAIRWLSDLQLKVYRKHFPGPTPSAPPELGGLHEAFEHFADGRLRLSDDKLYLNAEPDSGWFFSFGEFALLAGHFVEDADESKFWFELTRTLAWTQRLFRARYADPAPPGAGPHTFLDYGPGFYAQGSLQSAVASELQTAKSGAHTLDVASDAGQKKLHFLTAENAHLAFPGEEGLTTWPCP
ncbi:MAG: hypothetical protein AAF682_06220 [Planctomycetota bacterium]